MTLLVLSLLQGVFLYIKLNNQVVKNHKNFYQLEAMAYKLAMKKDGLASSDCIMTETNPNQIVDLLLAKQGCTLTDNNQNYHYLIDDLGLYPCLQVQEDKTIYSSHHWLISVATFLPHQAILQLRIAKPDRAITCERPEVHIINSGVISWRYL